MDQNNTFGLSKKADKIIKKISILGITILFILTVIAATRIFNAETDKIHRKDACEKMLNRLLNITRNHFTHLRLRRRTGLSTNSAQFPQLLSKTQRLST